MGVLAVGLIAKRIVKITNTGQSDAYFEFEPLAIPGIYDRIFYFYVKSTINYS